MKLITLTKKSDFDKMRSKGKRFSLKDLSAIFLHNSDSTSIRVAFAISKKIGNAVSRNRIRRKIREIIRKHPLSNELCYDVLFIPKKSVCELSHSAMSEQINKLFLYLSSK